MYFHEVTSDPFKRFGHIVKREEVPLYKGFKSLYCFDEQAKEYFKEIGQVKGLKEFPVGADTLTIDIDNDEESFQSLLVKVKAAGYKFEAWVSGGKGYHIILFHQFIFDRSLPFWQRCWIEDRKIKCDMCLYEHGRLIRLPHTVHAKTGNLKSLIDSGEGKEIVLDTSKTPPIESFSTESNKSEGFEMLSILLNKMSNSPITNGERNRRLYSLTRSFRDAGFSKEASFEFITLVNDLIEEPLEEEELTLIVNGLQ